MHYPFTSPKQADIPKMDSNDPATLKSMRADAYDLVLNGVEIGVGSIRDFIAFPKNNMGRDMMIDAPDAVKAEQLKELGIQLR